MKDKQHEVWLCVLPVGSKILKCGLMMRKASDKFQRGHSFGIPGQDTSRLSESREIRRESVSRGHRRCDD